MGWQKFNGWQKENAKVNLSKELENHRKHLEELEIWIVKTWSGFPLNFLLLMFIEVSVSVIDY